MNISYTELLQGLTEYDVCYNITITILLIFLKKIFKHLQCAIFMSLLRFLQDPRMYLTTSRLEESQQQESGPSQSLLHNIRGNEITCSFEEEINVEYVASKGPTNHEYVASNAPTENPWCLARNISAYFAFETEETIDKTTEQIYITADDASDSDSEDLNEQEELEAIQAESQSIAAAERLSQETESSHVPLLGMKFETDNDAYKFYNNYGFIVGFSITRYQTYTCKDKRDPMFGKITRRTFKCNMHGRSGNQEKDSSNVSGVQKLKRGRKRYNGTPPTPSTASVTKKTNKIQHTKCPAEMIITITEGMWTVTTINLEHNHPLAAKDQKDCLWSQTKMTDMEKKLIKTFSDANIKDSKIMAILSYIRGGTTPYKKNM